MLFHYFINCVLISKFYSISYQKYILHRESNDIYFRNFNITIW